MKKRNYMEINPIAKNMKLHKLKRLKLHEINWYKAINIDLWAHGKYILTIHKQNITENLYGQLIRKKVLKIYINMGESKDVH